MRLVSTKFGKINFKTGSHDTIHTFKNYFVTVFSIISFQFSTISDIQTDPKCVREKFKKKNEKIKVKFLNFNLLHSKSIAWCNNYCTGPQSSVNLRTR